MNVLPKEIVEKAFIEENGKYAWHVDDIFDALEAIAGAGNAILGIDLWTVKEGKRVNIIGEIRAMPVWNTGQRKSGEPWASYCERTFEEIRTQLKKILAENPIDKRRSRR